MVTVQLQEQRLPALDGMRGVAALCVLLHHAGFLANLPQVAEHGAIAVDLFFIISGYVIARAYEPRFDRKLNFSAFAKQRFLRLYPVIAVSTLICVVISIVSNDASPYRDWRVWTLHLFVLPDFTGYEALALNPVLWSLLLEYIANLMHRITYRRLNTKSLIVFVIMAALAYVWVASYYGGAGVGSQTSTFFGGFARLAWGYGIGILIYRVTASRPLLWPRPSTALLVILAVGMLFAPAFESRARTALPIFIGFPLLVMLSVSARQSSGWWLRLTTWLGEISYPLYAVHWPCLVLAGHILGRGAPATLWVVVLLAILGLATLIEGFVDAPLRRWLKARKRKTSVQVVA